MILFTSYVREYVLAIYKKKRNATLDFLDHGPVVFNVKKIERID